MLRRVVVVLVVLACAAGVVAYQATRPARAPANPKVFVPSPKFFQDFSPELPHVHRRRLLPHDGPVLRRARERRRPARLAAGDGRTGHVAQPALHARLSLQRLRAHRRRASRRRPTSCSRRASRRIPDDWRFPAYLGLLRLPVRHRARTRTWWPRSGTSRRRRFPGARPTCRGWPRSAGKGGEQREGHPDVGPGVPGRRQVRAPEGGRRASSSILPKEKEARMKAVAPLYDTMPKAEFDALIAELFKGYPMRARGRRAGCSRTRRRPASA